MKKGKIALIILLSVLFFIGIYFAATDSITELELDIARFFNKNRELNPIMKLFTNIGEAAGVIGVILLFLAVSITRRKIGLPLAVITAGSWLVNKSVKHLIARARPLDRLLEVAGYSFPSGHAMNNMALYLSIMLLVLNFCENRKIRIFTVLFCIAMPLLIGFSRIYFNVHYISDVLSGWALGAIIAIVGTHIYFNLESRGTEKNA